MSIHDPSSILRQVQRPPVRVQPSRHLLDYVEQQGSVLRAIMATAREPQQWGPSDVVGGMPLDRTVCPQCLNVSGEVEGCATCHRSGSVCPVCRGGRVVMVEQGGGERRPLYQACPGCCDPVETGERQPFGYPAYRYLPAREVESILAYRRKHGLDAEPF